MARIWDRFLTEQDRAVEALRPHRPVVFGEGVALLCVDMYRAGLGDRPLPVAESMKVWPSSCGFAGWTALPHVKRLLAAARELKIPIAHTTMLTKELSGIDEWFVRGVEKGSERQPQRGGVDGPWEIVYELRPIPGEAFIRKSAPSAFWGTPLVAHFNALGVDTIIVCGEVTSGCVRASVVDGRTYGFRMVVVEECVYDRIEAAHAMNLFDMNDKYADVISLEETLARLRDWRGRADTRISARAQQRT